jgi:hypothetical protein
MNAHNLWPIFCYQRKTSGFLNGCVFAETSIMYNLPRCSSYCARNSSADDSVYTHVTFAMPIARGGLVHRGTGIFPSGPLPNKKIRAPEALEHKPYLYRKWAWLSNELLLAHIQCCYKVLHTYSRHASAFSNLFVAYQYLLILCNTQGSCERVFSELKAIKTSLRAQVGNDKLELFMLTCSKKDLLGFISTDDVIRVMAQDLQVFAIDSFII